MLYPMICLFGLVAITAFTNADDVGLEIRPNEPVIKREVGSSLALTCRPKVPDATLVSQLEWRDPKNRPIQNTNSEAPMYIQKLQRNDGLMLIFSKLTENLEGTYTCRASYSNQQLQEEVKLVTIIGIRWLYAPEYQYPVIGSDYTVHCRVEAKPSPTVEWHRDGQTIMTNDRYVVKPEGLLITGVRESDDGIYSCRAIVIQSGNFDVKNIRLEVQIPPKIEPIANAIVVEGEAASVICKAVSKPPSNYTWIKIDSREDLSKKDRFVVHPNTGMMVINRAEFNDNSAYQCIAQNPAGIDKYVVNITVRVKPRIYQLQNVTAPIGNETLLECRATGRPAPVVLFRKLSRPDVFRIGRQPFDNRIFLENRLDEARGETFALLSIQHLRREDDGLYECIADNEIDKAFKNGHIAVEFPPTFDRSKNLQDVWTWQNKPGNLTCVAESFPNATIKWKLGNIELDGTLPYVKIEGTGPVSKLMVIPGQPKLYAQYECIATNRLGVNSTFFFLREAKEPGAVQQVTIAGVTATTIKFDIVGPTHLTGMPLRSFICRFRREEEPWDLARNRTWSVNAPYIIENLEPQRRYHFRFAGVNDVGVGSFQGAGVDYTMPMRSVPVEPKILVPPNDFGDVSFQDIVTVSPYADHYEIRWNVPYNNGDPIEYYIIRYCVTEKINGEWRDSLSECSSEIKHPFPYQSYELHNLLPDTTYKIELWAYNSIGSSSPAQIRMKTARGLDTVIPNHDDPAISSITIIGIAIGAVVLILIVVDGLCFCINRTGIIAFFCQCLRSKRVEEDDPKMSRDEKEPLSPENKEQFTAANERKVLTAEFDGKRVQMKPVEIGKYSAV